MASENAFELTKIIGDCSIFQVILTLVANSATIASGWGIMFMTFGAYNPGWVCLDGEMGNVSVNQSMATKELSSPLLHYSNEMIFSKNCSERKNCKHLLYNPDSRTIVTEWDLSCESSAIPSVIISIEMAGAFIGSYVAGVIGDKYGRKTSLYGHLTLLVTCQLLAIFSVSWQMYAVLFFFVGLAASGTVTSSYPYPLEFVNSWWRGVIISIPEWNMGFLIFTIAVYFVRNYMYLLIMATSWTGLVLLTAIWTPESVRWLTVSGKVDKAKQVVARIARMNGNAFPDTHIIDELAKKESARKGEHSYSYLDILRIPELRGYTIKLGIIWFVMAIIYFGLSFGLKSISGDIFINLIISAALELPALACAAPVANNLGRRSGAMLYISIETSCCFLLVILFLTTSGYTKDISSLVLSLLSKTFVLGAWGILIAFSTELYPTVLRSMSFGYLVSISRLASIVAPYILPNDPELVYISFIVIGIMGVISVGLIYSFPETNGKALSDMINNGNQNEDVALEASPMNDSSEAIS